MKKRIRSVLSTGTVVAAVASLLGVALLAPSAGVAQDRYVADEVVFQNERDPELEYLHIYDEPNVCIFGGFNCAIVIYPPDPVNPDGKTVAYVVR